MRRFEPSMAAMLVAAVLAVGSPVLAEDPCDLALRRRTDRHTAGLAVRACARAANENPAAVAPLEALARARYYLAQEYLAPKEAVEEYRRAIVDGLRGLSRLVDNDLSDMAELDEHRHRVPKSAVGVLYWTTLAYGSTISSLPFYRQPSAAKRFARLVRRTLTLDETYFHAGPHRVLAEYLREAPALLGGDDEAASTHALKAVQLAPDFAENHVVLAQVEAASDAERYRKALSRAVELADAADGDAAPEQRSAGRRARALMEKAHNR
ncbi:TRAP transporter TatT component family protein [Planctomycetota bacterium]